MKVEKIKLINIYLFIVVVFIFTNYIYGFQGWIAVLLTLFLLVIQLISHFKMKINFKDVMFLMLGVIFFVSAILSNNTSDALSYSIAYLCIVFSMIVLGHEKKLDFNYFFKLVNIFSFVHVVATILYFLFPSIVQSILPYILQPVDLAHNIYEYNSHGIVCGITPIQGLNAIYISLYLLTTFVLIYTTKKNRKRNIFFLLLGYVALFLASKRGLVLANLAAMIFIFLYDRYKNKKLNVRNLIKGIVISLVLICISYTILYNYFPDSLRILQRFRQDDITTGRIIMWQILWDSFKNGNLFFGNGIYSSRLLMLTSLGTMNDAHNIYLQLLVETGIIGFSVFVINFLLTLKNIVTVNYDKCEPKLILSTIYLIIVFFIYGFTGNWLFDVMTVCIYYTWLAMLFNYINTQRIDGE